ncbi:properdin-like isoform X1 [Phaenicophaeus curvirostris]|uniref:properdin-like isoform X1 n=1 Tax=Phaenicophaeus curvirostris TaxID=33595 RepID=UPI0037F0F36D
MNSSLRLWSKEPGRRGAVEQKQTSFVPQPSPGAVWPGLPVPLQAQPSLLAQLAWGESVSRGRGSMRALLLCAGWLLCAGCLLAAGYLAGVTGSCQRRCCPGRNNACWAGGSRRARCYCDSYCERTGDCCEDYHAACRRAAVGCVVGSWGPWSGCSSPCGVGSKARSRQVTVPPRHGGEPCPDLKQRRGCLGEHPTCGTAKEVAKILPSSFGRDFGDPRWRARLLPPEEPTGSEPPAAGRIGAASCTATSGCVSSAGETHPTTTPPALGTGCREPGRFGWPPLCRGARARGCRRGCRRVVSARRQLSSSCSNPLGRLPARRWSCLPAFSIEHFVEEWEANPVYKDLK